MAKSEGIKNLGGGASADMIFPFKGFQSDFEKRREINHNA